MSVAYMYISNTTQLRSQQAWDWENSAQTIINVNLLLLLKYHKNKAYCTAVYAWLISTLFFYFSVTADHLKLLLSFAVGGLLGDVFLHLLPEAWAHVHDGNIFNTNTVWETF